MLVFESPLVCQSFRVVSPWMHPTQTPNSVFGWMAAASLQSPDHLRSMAPLG